MTGLTLVYNFLEFLDQGLFFLINGNIIKDLHRFIMCNIIEMIEVR